MKKMFLKSVVAALLAALVAGCGGSGGGTLTGVVKDYKTGANLSDVTVKAGSQQTTTGSDGSFKLTGVASSEKIVVSFAKNHYVTAYKNTKLSNDITTADLQVSMVPVAQSGTLNPATPQSLKKSGETWQVDLGADALDATGNVQWEATPIDPSKMGIGVMAGDMQDDNGKSIESFGALVVSFKDASGNKVNLRNGESATIRIPASTRGNAALASSMPLYYFDEENGVWKQEGTATLKGTPPNQYYEGTVAHFSWWNADQPYDANTTITGCVEDLDGHRVAHALVKATGKDYNGIQSTYTDSEGNFSIKIRADKETLFRAQKEARVSNTVAVKWPTPPKQSLNSCLVLDAFTATLTWGANPSDLDTHVVGPDGPADYHIYWTQKGSLAGTGARSNLDVDDTTSYGPEVYTALKLPKAGTYHYAVYQYAGSSNIAASPAHVEVMLNGEKTVFVPTGTHTEKWWRVFDFTVNDDGKVTSIHKVDTWTNDTGWPVN